MRKEFKLTQEQLNRLLDACQPVPLIALQCGPSSSPQARANAAWDELGVELGFVGSSVLPVHGKGAEYFMAEAIEGGE